MRDFSGFAALLFAEWAKSMTGPFGVGLTLAGIFAAQSTVRWVFFVLAGICLLHSLWKVYQLVNGPGFYAQQTHLATEQFNGLNLAEKIAVSQALLRGGITHERLDEYYKLEGLGEHYHVLSVINANTDLLMRDPTTGAWFVKSEFARTVRQLISRPLA